MENANSTIYIAHNGDLYETLVDHDHHIVEVVIHSHSSQKVVDFGGLRPEVQQRILDEVNEL